MPNEFTMTPYVWPTATDAYQDWLATLTTDGVVVVPRGKPTREIQHLSTAFEMTHPIVAVPARKLSYVYLAAEALWILSGDDRVETLAPYNKHIAKFSDNGRTFFGAYGPRFVQQMTYVVQSIVDDHDTRQAVLTLWQPNPIKTKDVPCTVSLQFLLRDGALHAHVYMRSSDAWLGVPYDWFTFTMMALRVAALVNAVSSATVDRMGALYFTAGSAHYYAHNEADVKLAMDAPVDDPDPLPGDAVTRWTDVARSLTACRDRVGEADAFWRIRPVVSTE